MAGLPPLLSLAWPPVLSSGRPDEAEAMESEGCDWQEVSPSTVHAWREHAWRGRVDEPEDGGCKGGRSSGDEFAGPGTASACGESLAERDASMSNGSRRVAAASRRVRPARHKARVCAPRACAFSLLLPRRAHRPHAARRLR